MAATHTADPPGILQILPLVAEGHSNQSIATTLGVGRASVKAHLATAFLRFAARNRAHLTHRAYELHLLRPDPRRAVSLPPPHPDAIPLIPLIADGLTDRSITTRRAITTLQLHARERRLRVAWYARSRAHLVSLAWCARILPEPPMSAPCPPREPRLWPW